MMCIVPCVLYSLIERLRSVKYSVFGVLFCFVLFWTLCVSVYLNECNVSTITTNILVLRSLDSVYIDEQTNMKILQKITCV